MLIRTDDKLSALLKLPAFLDAAEKSTAIYPRYPGEDLQATIARFSEAFPGTNLATLISFLSCSFESREVREAAFLAWGEKQATKAREAAGLVQRNSPFLFPEQPELPFPQPATGSSPSPVIFDDIGSPAPLGHSVAAEKEEGTCEGSGVPSSSSQKSNPFDRIKAKRYF